MDTELNLSDSLENIGKDLSDLANHNRRKQTSESPDSVSYVTDSDEKEESLEDSPSSEEDVVNSPDNTLPEPVKINEENDFTSIKPVFTGLDQTSLPQLNPKEIRKRKFQMFIKIKELNNKHNISIPMNVTMNTSIDEIQMVLDTMIDSYRKRHAVESYRKMIVTGTTVVEWLNTKYDPFDFHLKGWSESVYKSIEASEYDDVFEELHEKYKSDSQMSPEMRLFMLLAGSAFMHHTFSKTNEKLNGLFRGSGNTNTNKAPKPASTSQNMSGPEGLDELLKEFRQSE